MNQRAFTLIEMLVATALSAVLLGALLLIAARLSSDRVQLAEHAAADHSGIEDLLDWDLHNAEQRESINAQTIELRGHNGIDPQTLQPNFRAVAVTYELQEAAHQLIRRQRWLDDPSAASSWQNLVAFNVEQLSLIDSDATHATLHLQLKDSTIEVTCPR